MDKLKFSEMASSEQISKKFADSAIKKVTLAPSVVPPSAAAATKQIIFHYVAGSCIFERRTITLTPDIECEIGRSIDGVCDPSKINAIFDCRVLSRNHAAIWCDQDDKYWLQDRKSSNGTFVNGIKLGDAAVELHCGDIIQLGSNVLTTAEKSFFKCIVARIGLPPAVAQISNCTENLPVIFNRTQMQIFISSLEMELKSIEREIFQCPLKNEVLQLIDNQLACHESAKDILRTANAERIAALKQLNKIELQLTASTNECEHLRKQIASLQSRHKIVKDRLRLQVMVYQECCIEKAKQHFLFEQESKRRIEKLNQQIEECEKDYEKLCATIAEIMRETTLQGGNTVQAAGLKPAEAEVTNSKDTSKNCDEEIASLKALKSKCDQLSNIIAPKQQSNNDQDNMMNVLKSQQQAAVKKTTSMLKMAVELFNEIYEEIFTNHLKTAASGEKLNNGSKVEDDVDMEAKRVVRFIIKKLVTMPGHAQLEALRTELQKQSNTMAAISTPWHCDDCNVEHEIVAPSASKTQHQMIAANVPKDNCFVTFNMSTHSTAAAVAALASAEQSHDELTSTEQMEKDHLKADRKIIIVQENLRNITVMPYITILVTIAYVLIAYLFMKYL